VQFYNKLFSIGGHYGKANLLTCHRWQKAPCKHSHCSSASSLSLSEHRQTNVLRIVGWQVAFLCDSYCNRLWQRHQQGPGVQFNAWDLRGGGNHSSEHHPSLPCSRGTCGFRVAAYVSCFMYMLVSSCMSISSPMPVQSVALWVSVHQYKLFHARIYQFTLWQGKG
jgi:hypothetical protein